MAQLYADFHTSLGTFTCELNAKDAPRTVANFITLAEGTRAWLDERSGTVVTDRPFYDGLAFHRVVDREGFRIAQAGSRKGDGTDGPGYTLPEESDPLLPAAYHHDQPYLLSMANAGPNSNGSQFFLTGCAIPSLDGKHTIFGAVVSGRDVVDELLDTAADENDHPRVPVVIRRVTVRRVGREARDFDPLRITLPSVTAPGFRASVTPGESATLSFPQPARSLLRVWDSDDGGRTWEDAGRRYLGPVDRDLNAVKLDLPPIDEASGPFQFRPSLVSYPEDALAPSSVAGFQLHVGNESGDYFFQFDGDPSYLLITPSGESRMGSIRQFLYEAEGYGATLIVDLGDDGSFRFRLAPDSRMRGVLSGRHTGEFYNFLIGWTPFEENDEFTLSPLEN